MPVQIHWFRRDLRLADNTALAAAARRGTVLPVFVIDPEILRRPDTGPARFAFLCAGLQALDKELRQAGSRLLVRQGEPAAVLREVARRHDATGLFFNRDYEPFATDRDARVTSALQSEGLAVKSHKDDVLAELGELPGPRPFQVFTPFFRAWMARITLERLIEEASPGGQFVGAEAIDSDPLPTPAQPGGKLPAAIPKAGHLAGNAALERFARDAMGAYSDNRDRLDRAASSRISYFLRFGMVSIRECLRLARRHPGPGSEAWQRQLAWRDFYRQLLAATPRLERESMDIRLSELAWNDDPARLLAWREGLTGYPVVDAAMRQLAQEGWLPNRARLITASFLTKDLGIHWRQGERVFMERLLDGDLANNNGGWQWVAGTGADPQPFFRVFNPTLQGQRFDPEGAYVRRWCPELAGIPAAGIHEPRLLPSSEQRRWGCVIGRDYPAPIVDHQQARQAAIGRFALLRAKAGASGAAPRSHARS